MSDTQFTSEQHTVSNAQKSESIPLLPLIEPDVEYLYDVVHWSREAKQLSSTDPTKHVRVWLMNEFQEQSSKCRASSHGTTDLNVLYGQPAEAGIGTEAYDWFAPCAWNTTQHVIVYIHGGFWRAIDLPECSHWAEPVTQAGGVFVALAYRLAPWQAVVDMPGRLCAALQHVYEHTVYRTSQSTTHPMELCIHLVGHSAGAQLVMEMLALTHATHHRSNSWFSVLKSAVIVSGLYDLRPMMHTSVNTALRFKSTEEAWMCSPLRFLQQPDESISDLVQSVRWLVSWAEHDPPGFIDQSKLCVELLKQLSSGRSHIVEEFSISNEDHFSSVHGLYYGVEHSALLQKILHFVGLL